MSDASTAIAPSALQPPYPDALRPHIAIGQPNEPISLYSGPIDFTQRGKTFRADALITLKWLPTPKVWFEVPSVPRGVYPRLEDVSLRLDDGTEISSAVVKSLHLASGPKGYSSNLSGRVWDRVLRPADGPVRYVLFLLPNFDQPIGHGVHYPDGSDRAFRLTLEGGGWIITLDELDDRAEVQRYLKANSGFGVTQVGRLEKEDHSTFSVEDALAALDALKWYVSFAAGQWTSPYLPAGFSSDGKRVWEVWDHHRTVPFRDLSAWLDRIHGEQFEGPFSGFMSRWLDNAWEEVIRLAVHWYIEANAGAGSIEGSIVLTQTAFELLGSAVLVDHHGWLSTRGYEEKLEASDRVRLLFLWAGIPTEIPSELGDLVKLAKAYEEFMINKRPDSAAAMTTIRNTITHSTRKNREKFRKHSDEARRDAWILGLRNLELCLLRLFNHQGTYANRIRQKHAGDVEPVPWAAVPLS
jgi:hypothetical protein